jgi:hypothetical protein
VAAGALTQPWAAPVLVERVITCGLLSRHVSRQMNDYCPKSSPGRCKMFYTVTISM